MVASLSVVPEISEEGFKLLQQEDSLVEFAHQVVLARLELQAELGDTVRGFPGWDHNFD